MSEFEKWYSGRDSFQRHTTPKKAMEEAYKAGLLRAAEICKDRVIDHDDNFSSVRSIEANCCASVIKQEANGG